MAALESTKFVRFTLPPSNLSFSNTNALWSAETSHSIHSVYTGSQKICQPVAAFPRSRRQDEVDWNIAARTEVRKGVLANNYDESDDDLPSPEELLRTAPRPKTSNETSKPERTLQYLEQPALNGAGIQVDRTKSGLGERQGNSPDQLMILDDKSDEAGADVDTGRIERDATPHNTIATSDLASGPAKSIDTSGLWYDVEEGCYINEPALRLGSGEQQRVTPAPAQAQPQTLPQSSTPLQDRTNQQSVGSITRRTSVESAVHSLPEPSDSGDNGWTDDSMAELEKELELALEEQGNLLSASAPTSSRPRLVEAPQDEIQSRERTETTGNRPEELQDASRHGAAQGLEEWKQQEMVAEGRGVAMQEQEQEQEDLTAEKEELRQPPVGDQQDLVKVVDADDPENKKATKALPATQPEIDEHRFRLRGRRTQLLAGRQTKTTQYRVVWGEHPNRCDSWVDEDDMRISMPPPPCERSSQDLVPQVGWEVVRVSKIRKSQRSQRRIVYEYFVDKHSTWIAEDQLRVSLSSTLLSELRGSSPHPLSQAQSEVHLKYSATPISDEHRHASQASRSSSAPADPALGGELATRKRGHQDMHTDISSDAHYSLNTDDNHSTCDTSDEDPQPAKRRKPRLARAVTPPLHPRQSPPLRPPPTTRPEIDEAQSQDDHGCSSTFIDEQHCASRTSRSPSAASEAVPAAKYQEWPFQGFLKRIRIGDDVTYNLEFTLPSISEHLHLPIDPKALDIYSSKKAPAEVPTHHEATIHSKRRQALLQPKKKRKHIEWTTEEDKTLLQMRNDGCSWEEIAEALPHRTRKAIQVHFSTSRAGVGKADVSGGQQQKRPRGRPRKQT